jgi:hypothetical protein
MFAAIGMAVRGTRTTPVPVRHGRPVTCEGNVAKPHRGDRHHRYVDRDRSPVSAIMSVTRLEDRSDPSVFPRMSSAPVSTASA